MKSREDKSGLLHPAVYVAGGTLRGKRIVAAYSLACAIAVVGCGGSDGNQMLAEDAGRVEDGGMPDSDTAPDIAVDTGPVPECVEDEGCDDGDTCTTDTCEVEECMHVNPSATCERFDGGECAGDLATELITVEQTFCIPGFAVTVPEIGDVSLCQGVQCSDVVEGCLITIETTGLPSSEPAPNVLRVRGTIERIRGSVPFSGTVPIPNLPPIPLNCTASFSVGSGLPVSADLLLAEEAVCGTDREVRADTDVDLSMLTLQLTGTGGDFFPCLAASAVLSPLVAQALGDAEAQLEAGIDAVLDGLDCGVCDAGCPADLVCRVPLP